MHGLYPRLLSRLFLLAGLLLAFAFPATATTFTVSNTDDAGAGSLRQAILDANADAAAPHTLDASLITGSINLNSPLPAPTRSVTVNGPATGTLAANGQGSLHIFEPFTTGGITITFNDIQFVNGYRINFSWHPYFNPIAGNVFLLSAGTLVLNRCHLANCYTLGNEGPAYGAVVVNGGSLTADSCRFENCDIGTNLAPLDIRGGAVMVQSGASTFINCAIWGCNVETSHNWLAPQGGALYFQGGTNLVYNTLIFSNFVHAGSGPPWLTAGGSAIYSTGNTTVINCTVAGNNMSSFGMPVEGAIMCGGGSLTLQNTLVANNGGGTTESNVYGGANADYCLLETSTGLASSTNDVAGPSVFVNAGAGNYRLVNCSAGTNAGFNGYNPTATDLAGNTRIQGTAIDLGAYETSPVTLNLVVTNTNDAGAGSLRQAILDLNAASCAIPPYTINATGVTGTIALASPLPAPVVSVTVNGPASTSGTLAVSGQNTHRIFSSMNTAGVTLALQNLTFQNARATGVWEGNVFTVFDGSLELDSCTLKDNLSNTAGGDFAYGAVLFWSSGAFTATNSVFDNCDATAAAGGAQAGGLTALAGALTVHNTVFRNCNATSASGQAAGGAVAIGATPGTSAFTNCLFHGNTASSGGSAGVGSAFWQGTAWASTLTNCTFSGNTCVGAAGADGAVAAGAGTLTLLNSIVSGNTGGTSESNLYNFSNGAVITTDYCLLQTTTGTVTATNAVAGTPTFVNAGTGDYRLANCSAGAEAGLNAHNPTATDLAGNTRIQGVAIDLGPYETTPVPLTFMVTNTNGNGPGSLRQAILDLNAATGPCAVPPYTIDATGVTGNINLSAAVGVLPVPTKSVTINGPTLGTLVVSGVGQRGIFAATPGFATPGITVTINRLQFQDGYATTSIPTLFNVTGSTLTLNNCNLLNSSTGSTGASVPGAISVSGTGTLNANNCVFDNLTTYGAAGAGGNQGNGGAIRMTGGTARIEASVFRNCQAGTGILAANGGAIDVGPASLTAINCLFYNNQAYGNGGASVAKGSAIRVSTGTATLVNCTFANNSLTGIAPTRNGCVALDGAGTLTLQNCIVQDNTGGTGESNLFRSAGTATADYCRTETATGVVPTNAVAVNASFSNIAVGNYRLTSCSAGHDAALASHLTAVTASLLDLAGTSRVLNSGLDIGAYESDNTAITYPVVVTNTNDAGPGSLRQAILDLNATVGCGIPGSPVIDATGVTGTILLASSLPDFTLSATVNGPTTGTLAVSGQNTYRLFDYYSTGVTRTFNDMTFQEARTVFLTTGTVFHVLAGSLELNNCTVKNSATVIAVGGWVGYGAVVADASATAFTANGCVFDNCDISTTTGLANGGAVNLMAGDGTLNRCIFRNCNAANTGGSGLRGALTFASGGTLSVSNSLFHTNGFSAFGGTNVGAAFTVAAGTATATNCTFAANTLAGGVVRNGAVGVTGGTLTLRNSVVSGNTGGSTESNVMRTAGTLNTEYSLLATASGVAATTNQVLGAVAFVNAAGNDFRLTACSPGTNRGSNALNALPLDLDGNPRVQNTTIDLGAYESASNLLGGPFVTSLDDAGANTLRQAILDVNASPGCYVWPLVIDATAATGNILLASSLPAPAFPVTVEGPAAGSTLAVDGQGTQRIFAAFANATVSTTINRLTFQNGFTNTAASTPNVFELTAGNLTLNACTLRNNLTSWMGVSNAIGAVYITAGAVFTANETVFDNCDITAGSNGARGGAIRSVNGTAVLNRCTFRNNNATAGTSPGTGGAIDNTGGTLTATNCLFYTNGANSTSNTAYGSAIRTTGTATLTNCTVAGNALTGNTSGRYGAVAMDLAGTLTLHNTLVYGNTGTNGATPENNVYVAAGTATADYCLLQTASAAVTATNAVAGTPVFLDPGTGNYRLHLSSPGVDQGLDAHNATTEDLEGNPRSSIFNMDIGAYEVPMALHAGAAQPNTYASEDRWIHIGSASNLLAASVRDLPGGGNLGITTATMTVDATVGADQSGVEYLQRHVTITPATNGPARVRVFFTQTELDALIAADPAYSTKTLNDLAVNKFNYHLNTFITPASITYYADVEPGIHCMEFDVTGFSSFSMSFEALDINPLPVDGLFLTAHTEGQDIHLEWTTQQERNNHGFGVEVLHPGASAFQQAAYVPGAVHSDAPLAYGHTLHNLAPGHYLLRLRQVDLDGTSTHSNTVAAFIGGNGGTLGSVVVYPNPSRSGFRIIGLEAPTVAEVHDAQGRLVWNGSLEPGAVLGQDLSTGTYSLRLRTPDGQHRLERLVVLP